MTKSGVKKPATFMRSPKEEANNKYVELGGWRDPATIRKNKAKKKAKKKRKSK